MKKHLTWLLLLLVVISCNNKKEELPIEEAMPDVSYVYKPVGIVKGGEYSVSTDSVAYQWAAGAKEKLGLSARTVFSDFKIVKVKTQGKVEDCYLLMAKNSDRPGALASVLHLEGDVFYFDRLQEGGNTGVQVILCKGSCGEVACYPIVVVSNTKKKLICSTCSSCDKNVSLIY